MIETRFKQTELGPIPEDWDIVSLSDILENFIGLTYSPDDVRSYGTLVLRSSNIQNDRLCFNENVFVEMNIPERARAKKGDILVCVRNGSKALIGKSAIINEDGMAFGAFMTVLRSHIIVQQFILYLWRSRSVQEQIQNCLGATINQITNGDIARFKVPIPLDVSEQKKIAETLSDVDKLIEELEKLIAKKVAMKRGAMQQILTGRKRLPGFSDPWVEKKIGNVLSIGNGRDYRYLQHGNVPVYGSGGIIEYVNQCLYEGETVCIGRKGTIDHPMYFSGKIWTVDTLFYTHSFIDASPKFIYYLFHTIDWLSYNEATGVPSLSKVNILQIKILIPCLEEQRAIAGILTDMDNEIQALRQKEEKYEKIKQGMMQQLLTGRIRLIDPASTDIE